MHKRAWGLTVAIALGGALAGCAEPEPEVGGGGGGWDEPGAERVRTGPASHSPGGLAGEAGLGDEPRY